MNSVLSMAAAVLIASGAGAMAQELPSFAAKGFPISPVQVQLVGAAGVDQQPTVVALAVDGLSATPVQLSVLKPRAKRTAAAIEPAVTRTGVVAR